MLPTGQIPHHFIDTPTNPTYIAISGATQTGPNIFWSLSTLRLGRLSGDYAWLKQRLPFLERSLNFLFATYDQDFGLVSTKGSLYIDTFIRQNFTADTNVALVYLLQQIAEAQEFFGNTSRAIQLRTLADSFVAAINNRLWSTQNDHYITNLDRDGKTRDFVDYDSNTLAVAFDVAPTSRYPAVLKRVDSGNCTHAGRATYVSERYYDAANCFLGNTGDSNIAMGRIAWGDGVARYRVGDTSTFYNKIYNPILNDLFRYTWLYERYDCQGKFAHNPYYHEYPETIFMLMHEVVFGIRIGLGTVRIAPFPETPGPVSYTYGVGNTYITYSQDQVSVLIPGAGAKNFTIERLLPSTNYVITSVPSTVNLHPISSVKSNLHAVASIKSNLQTVRSDAQGILSFVATTGLDTTVLVQRQN